MTGLSSALKRSVFVAVAATLLLGVQMTPVPGAWAGELPHIAVVSTGGTIAEKTDPKTGGAVPAVSGSDLVKAVPGLAKIAKVTVVNFSNIDSSQMTPQIWAKLSKKVNELLADPKIKGVVVTHGTDTMAEGAYFLDVTTKSDKPVVFTGAMNDASSPFPDGPGNLYNAVAQAASDTAKGWGVTVTLNGYINSARDVRKTQTTNVQTFTSGEKGYLGYIFNGKVIRYNDRVRRVHLPLPETLPKVPYISDYAGSDGALVKFAVDNGAQGLVIEGVGAGNVNKDVYKSIEHALDKGLPVAVSSRVYYGEVEPVYGDQGGGKTLQDRGCILTGDLVGTKARLLLMLGIARYGKDTHAIKALFE